MLPALKNALASPLATTSAASSDRRPRLASERRHGRLAHLDDISGLDKANVDPTRLGMPRQLALDRGALADERQPTSEMTGRDQRPSHDVPRRKITTGRVYGNTHPARSAYRQTSLWIRGS